MTAPFDNGLSEQNTGMDQALIMGYPKTSTTLTIKATYKALSATQTINITVG